MGITIIEPPAGPPGPPGPEGPPGPTSVGYIEHGDDPNVERPEGFLSVFWKGSVEPLNGTDDDFWVKTNI